MTSGACDCYHPSYMTHYRDCKVLGRSIANCLQKSLLFRTGEDVQLPRKPHSACLQAFPQVSAEDLMVCTTLLEFSECECA